MSLKEIRESFDAARRLRKGDPLASLEAVRVIAIDVLELMATSLERHGIEWQGFGEKTYDSFCIPGRDARFSRAVNRDLFVPDPVDLSEMWDNVTVALEASVKRGEARLAGIDGRLLDRLVYTTVIGFAAVVDVLGTGDRGGPGTFFEMTVGPIVSLLTGRTTGGAITIPIPETDESQRIPTDLSFAKEEEPVVLVIPTKISTRERISQAYVHQAILSKAGAPSVYRSALCVGNENNMVLGQGEKKSIRSAAVKDTLVPDTIVQYQSYIAELAGLYYLDPPHEYINKPRPAFPAVKRFQELLTKDLPALLNP